LGRDSVKKKSMATHHSLFGCHAIASQNLHAEVAEWQQGACETRMSSAALSEKEE